MHWHMSRVQVPVGLYMYPRIKSDTYRSTECVWNRLDGGESLLWSCGYFLMSNIKFETLTQHWGKATFRCKMLISNNLHQAACIASPRRCRHWSREHVSFSHWHLLPKPKKNLVVDNKFTSSFEHYKSSLCVQWRWNEWCAESFYCDGICELRSWFKADGKFHWVV